MFNVRNTHLPRISKELGVEGRRLSTQNHSAGAGRVDLGGWEVFKTDYKTLYTSDKRTWQSYLLALTTIACLLLCALMLTRVKLLLILLNYHSNSHQWPLIVGSQPSWTNPKTLCLLLFPRSHILGLNTPSRSSLSLCLRQELVSNCEKGLLNLRWFEVYGSEVVGRRHRTIARKEKRAHACIKGKSLPAAGTMEIPFRSLAMVSKVWEEASSILFWGLCVCVCGGGLLQFLSYSWE